MLADITEVLGSDNGVEEDDAAMCITNHTNQSIYYFTTPRYHDHNVSTRVPVLSVKAL